MFLRGNEITGDVPKSGTQRKYHTEYKKLQVNRFVVFLYPKTKRTEIRYAEKGGDDGYD